MKFIDTHTHLYLRDFADDINEVLQRAEATGVEKFYLPAIDSTESQALLALGERFPGKCFPMMGLHPCSVKENYKEELEIVAGMLEQRKFSGIGETGLDFYWDNTFVKEQYESLHLQAEWAIRYDLPLVLHTRDAIQETIDAIKTYEGRGLRGIFHCFGGTLENAREIISMGFYLGIGGIITYKNAGIASVIREIDLEHLVLETDAPYLTPVPFRGKRNESSYIKYVAEKIAEIKNISIEEVAWQTSENARKIFPV